MRIGVIGSGNVGGALGKRWAGNGHTVTFSSRDPESDEMKQLVAAAGPAASAGSIAEVVDKGDVLLVATPWAATRDVLQSAGNLAGKVLIDATNPLLPRLQGLEFGTTTSGAEQVADWAKGAKVVKAFNTVGANIMVNSQFEAGPAVMFYCSDDITAKSTVAQLITELGFDAVDAGPLAQARLLEPFALLWITQAMSHGREMAFQLMRRA